MHHSKNCQELQITLDKCGITVEQVYEAKVLGVTKQGVTVMKTISKFLCPDVRRQVLNALVLSQPIIV